MRIRFSSVGWKGSIRPFTASFSWNDIIVLNLDTSGRWLSVIMDKITYRRGLNGDWMGISREKDTNERQRIYLTPEDKRNLYTKIHKAINNFEEIILSQPVEIDYEPNDPLAKISYNQAIEKWLTLMKNTSYEKDISDAANYHTLYSKVGILPPDRYGSLVLQVTEGCAYNQCTFCDFYHGVKFHQRTPEEFKNHVINIKKFLGDSIGRFHSIFLGDANALMVEQNELLGILDIINKEFVITKAKRPENPILKSTPNFAGIYSFLDIFLGHKKAVNDYIQIAQRNVRTVYLGIESGSVDLLHFLKKPNKINHVLELVEHLHTAKIGVGAIILVGAGGEKYKEQHELETLELLKSMELNSNDIIYFSEIVTHPNTQYAIGMENENIQPCSNADMEKQILFMKSKIKAWYPEGKNSPQIAKYEIRDFLY